MKKLQHFLLAATLLMTPCALKAEDSCDNDYCDLKPDFCDAGCAYEDCRRAPHVSPCLAFGFVVTVGVIALLVVNGDSHAFSFHSHSHS